MRVVVGGEELNANHMVTQVKLTDFICQYFYHSFHSDIQFYLMFFNFFHSEIIEIFHLFFIIYHLHCLFERFFSNLNSMWFCWLLLITNYLLFLFLSFVLSYFSDCGMHRRWVCEGQETADPSRTIPQE